MKHGLILLLLKIVNEIEVRVVKPSYGLNFQLRVVNYVLERFFHLEFHPEFLFDIFERCQCSWCQNQGVRLFLYDLFEANRGFVALQAKNSIAFLLVASFFAFWGWFLLFILDLTWLLRSTPLVINHDPTWLKQLITLRLIKGEDVGPEFIPMLKK